MSHQLKYLILLVVLMPFAGIAQTQDSYEYESEFTWGINKNTFGGHIGGFTFKKARKINDRQLVTIGLEIMNVKHPQERRVVQSGNYFIYGKNNYLYAFRFQYGRDFILFKKAPQQGVEVKAVFAAGPTFGIVAPYYVEYVPTDAGGGGFITKREQYRTDINISTIVGPGRLFEGLGKSKIQPGFNLKMATNFELGTFKSQVTGFEAGFLLDVYAKSIELMPIAKNYSAFPTFFITLFYGNRK